MSAGVTRLQVCGAQSNAGPYPWWVVCDLEKMPVFQVLPIGDQTGRVSQRGQILQAGADGPSISRQVQGKRRIHVQMVHSSSAQVANGNMTRVRRGGGMVLSAYRSRTPPSATMRELANTVAESLHIPDSGSSAPWKTSPERDPSGTDTSAIEQKKIKENIPVGCVRGRAGVASHPWKVERE